MKSHWLRIVAIAAAVLVLILVVLPLVVVHVYDFRSKIEGWAYQNSPGARLGQGRG